MPYYDPGRHRRRSTRLQEYDYGRPGIYFVTVGVQDRLCLLGRVVEGEVRLTPAGLMVRDVWEGVPERFAGWRLDEWMVMPNHLHGLLVLDGDPGNGTGVSAGEGRAGTRPAPTDARGARQALSPTLGAVVGAFKSITTHRYARAVTADGWPSFPGRLWQRNYYEHVVRDRDELDRARRYIRDNPVRWTLAAQRVGR